MWGGKGLQFSVGDGNSLYWGRAAKQLHTMLLKSTSTGMLVLVCNPQEEYLEFGVACAIQ